MSNLRSLQFKSIITGIGRTRKTYITKLTIDWINSQDKTHQWVLLHKILVENYSGYQLLAFYNLEFKKNYNQSKY